MKILSSLAIACAVHAVFESIALSQRATPVIGGEELLALMAFVVAYWGIGQIKLRKEFKHTLKYGKQPKLFR